MGNEEEVLEPKIRLQQELQFANTCCRENANGQYCTCGGKEGRVARKLVEGIKKRGGATLDPRTGRRVDKGYAVAGLSEAKMISASDVSTPQGEAATREALKRWVKEQAAKGAFDDPNVKVGAWVDGKEVWVEPSQHVMDRDEAIRLGTSRNQKEIADLVEVTRSRGKRGFINTGGTGEI